jgi:hypothetical protein
MKELESSFCGQLAPGGCEMAGFCICTFHCKEYMVCLLHLCGRRDVRSGLEN